MFVIVVYDVQAKINAKILKVFRKYLFHVQNSVFEGNISEGMLNQLKKEVSSFSKEYENQFVFYQFQSEKALHKEVLGNCAPMMPLLT